MLDPQLHSGTAPAGAVPGDALRAACGAPSLHNSQPWQFRVDRDRTEDHPDRSRVSSPPGTLSFF